RTPCPSPRPNSTPIAVVYQTKPRTAASRSPAASPTRSLVITDLSGTSDQVPARATPGRARLADRAGAPHHPRPQGSPPQPAPPPIQAELPRHSAPPPRTARPPCEAAVGTSQPPELNLIRLIPSPADSPPTASPQPGRHRSPASPSRRTRLRR